MSNIINYLEKNGYKTFRQSPFNEVDNLVLCQLSYVDFNNIVPSEDMGKSVTVQKASEAYFKVHSEEEMLSSKSLLKTASLTLNAMANSKRFQKAKLSRYVNEIDENNQKQFAALNITLDDGTVYVVFRGTDDNLVSWQESFNLCCEIVPSQIDAVQYLKDSMAKSRKKIRIGGHSKGGNLAVYSAMNAPEDIRKRIIKIYNNDGPGFSEEIVRSLEYNRISNKIIRYTPEFSIFGTLLEYNDCHKIISSNSKGIQQHDLMNWEISGNHLVYKEKNAKESSLISESIKIWAGNLKKNQKKAIGKSLFNTLKTKGVSKIYDISLDGVKDIYKTMHMFSGLNKPTRVVLRSLLMSFVSMWTKDIIYSRIIISNN